MSKLIGFDYARVALVDNDTETIKAKSDLFPLDGTFIVNAKTSEGVISANITGFAPNLSPVYGSNQIVEMSGKGTGSIKTALGVNDMPENVKSALLGMKQDTATGAYVLTKDTKPPKAALELVSADGKGHVVHLAMPKGVFTQDDKNLQTDTEQEQRVTDGLTFNAMHRDSDGLVYAFASEGNENYTEDGWNKMIFPKTVSEVRVKNGNGVIVNSGDGTVRTDTTQNHDKTAPEKQ